MQGRRPPRPVPRAHCCWPLAPLRGQDVLPVPRDRARPPLVVLAALALGLAHVPHVAVHRPHDVDEAALVAPFAAADRPHPAVDVLAPGLVVHAEDDGLLCVRVEGPQRHSHPPPLGLPLHGVAQPLHASCAP
eukprot:9694130-Lingulodinium_polyedra.AAC.2